MAKQPASELTDNPRQTRLFLFIILGLSLITLLGLGYTQLNTAHAQTSPPNVNFGSATVGTQGQTKDVTFSVSNTYSYTVNVTDSKSGAADFVVTNDGCNDVNISPGQSCSVTVRFDPQAVGPRSGSITFSWFANLGLANPGSGEAKANSVGGSNATVNSTLFGPAQQVATEGSSTTTLTGIGLAVVTTAAPTTVAPTTVAPTTRASSNCASQIQGYVLIDGQPGAGIVVNLTGPANNSVTIGEGGYFYFNDLCQGNYTISLQYDHSKYKANDADTRKITLDGVNASRNNAFSLSTITATTTAAPTTATGTTPAQTTPAPTTPAVATTAPAQSPSCNLPSGTVLRVCVATTQQGPTHFAVVLGVSAGDSPVNLNDTVIVNLPAGAIVTSATSAVGAVTVSSNNTVRWGSFSLNPKQDADLVLSIDAPAGNLNGSSIFVSGSFNRSQAFQQRIPGLPGLTDIVPAVPQNTGTGTSTGTGGQGGGSTAPSQVPSQAPATGAGQENSQDTPVVWLILAAIVSGSLGIFGLVLVGRGNKTDKKEQK